MKNNKGQKDDVLRVREWITQEDLRGDRREKMRRCFILLASGRRSDEGSWGGRTAAVHAKASAASESRRGAWAAYCRGDQSIIRERTARNGQQTNFMQSRDLKMSRSTHVF